MRVHELAKKLGVTSKELIAQIRDLGGEVKSHMSQVDEEIVFKIENGLKADSSPEMPAAEKKSPQEKIKLETSQPQPPKEESSAAAPSEKQAEPSTDDEDAAFEEELKKLEEEEKKNEIVPETATPAEDDAIALRFPITVGNLAQELNLKIPELIKTLMGLGVFANVNQLLNEEIVFQAAEKLEIKVRKLADEVEEFIKKRIEAEDSKNLKLRPPVVTMMGHVDHGKTSLLDAIRSTNVVAREKGAITQHIGAYGVDIPGKGHVTFLDTPGHEAFTAMRARGANVTDVVVLVVAADDGVMPQTVEAIDHAKEAGCPIVVAINKCDLPSANPQKVMLELQKIDLIAEEWGGKTIIANVSAKSGDGIENLLDMLLLESEVLELRANPDCAAVGTVVEGHLSRGSGPVATVIVQKGTLRTGDMVVCGPHMGRVRALKNDLGRTVKEAGPSYAAEMSGLSGIPDAGQTFYAVEDEKTARKITEKRILEEREREMSSAQKHLSLETLYDRISKGNFKELKMIIKADVQGSSEALKTSLERLGTDKCHVRVIHSGIGGVNESDIMLAAASDAIVVAFHVKADPKAQEIGEREGVDMRFYNIIYEAVEDVRKAMEGILEPTVNEIAEGKLQVRKVFKVSRVGTVGGGIVVKGKVLRNNPIRVVRNQVVVHEGKFGSLKRFKDDVREVAQGYECGFAVERFNDLNEGDIIESYRLEKVAQKL